VSTIAAHPQYRRLLAHAAPIGRDPLLIQAAGGNVWLKHQDLLWVKASGTWLTDTLAREGPGVAVADTVHDIAPARAELLAVPGAGVLLREDASVRGAAPARSLADVLSRLSPDEPIAALLPSDGQGLLGWDAEEYRPGLARA
jgi:rhamnose utilization protein RhaD (predicted bifunctional aldolase and dehydrogenase)